MGGGVCRQRAPPRPPAPPPDLSPVLRTDLCDGGDVLRDFFDPERPALHREAVAAAAGGTSCGRPGEEGRDDQDKPGEPQEGHGGSLTADLLCQNTWKERSRERGETDIKLQQMLVTSVDHGGGRQ